MSGKPSRRKGNRFQQRLARWLREDLSLGEFWKTTQETQQGNIGDVIDINHISPLVFEAKWQKHPSPWKALKQVEEATGKDELGVAVVHRIRGQTLCIMTPDTLGRLLVMAFLSQDPTEVGDIEVEPL